MGGTYDYADTAVQVAGIFGEGLSRIRRGTLCNRFCDFVVLGST